MANNDQDARKELERGNHLVVEEDFGGACDAYTKAISLDAKCVDAFVNRAAVRLKSGDAASALADSQAALDLDVSNVGALRRKGEACFALDKFAEAKAAFTGAVTAAEQMDGQAGKIKIFKTWLRKCETELTDTNASAESETSPAVVVVDDSPADSTSTPADDAVPVAVDSTPQPAPFPYKHDWYQTATHVTVSVLAKGADKLGATVEVDESTNAHVVVTIADKVLRLALFAPVDTAPGQVRSKVTASKVEVKLKKQNGMQWPVLERTAANAGVLPVVSQVVTGPTPIDPASAETALPSAYANKGKAKNWDKFTDEEEDPEGEEALNKLFKQIYSNATDETRRAMNKSFQTSGGTVLSTNWGEVAEKDYEKERVAPDGMDWKTWEGKKIKSENGEENSDDVGNAKTAATAKTT